MPTQTKKASSRAVVVENGHRATDAIGISAIALSIIVAVALGVGQAGLIGDTLSSVFTNLFGRGAWAMPVGLGIFGVSLVLGRRHVEISRFLWGLTLIFLTVVGALARPLRGDFFDPEALRTSGGYFGAILGWAFTELLGQARGVGLGAMCMLGLVLCINTPIHAILEKIKEKTALPEKRPSVVLPKASRPDPVAALQAEELADRKEALRQAVMNTVDTVSQTIESARPKIKPVIAETKKMESMISAPEPKEGYTLPSLDLLQAVSTKPKRTREEMERNITTLESTLEEFGIEANVVEIATGPTITRYEVQLGPGVRVGRITALGDNLAMNLAASNVRVEAPIPGKAAVGVEVPNASPSMVTLREVCEDPVFQNHPSRLCVALGQDVSGRNCYADLTKMPHLLIGGATNSGKSIGLATIITSLLIRNTPKDLRLVMIDPKRVELTLFDDIPHLLCPVIKDTNDAPGILRAIWREMDVRYEKLSERKIRNIDGWNEQASFNERMPYIVVIIDELADLMIQAAAEVETSIVRLAQLARAVGIHLVIATQRPSADVVTGLIKANVPSRMAFAVGSSIDSRVIMDVSGAERLIGRGDMLFKPVGQKPQRIQGCYVSEKEIEEICQHWKDQEPPHYVLAPIDAAVKGAEAKMRENNDELDALWREAVTWVAERGEASTSMLQRKFSIGFQRASRLLDTMESRGIVGPKDGARPRQVLITATEAEYIAEGNEFGGGPSIDIDPF